MRKEEMEFYVSPNVKIVEIKTSQILCGSNEPFGLREGNYDDWE